MTSINTEMFQNLQMIKFENDKSELLWLLGIELPIKSFSQESYV